MPDSLAASPADASQAQPLQDVPGAPGLAPATGSTAAVGESSAAPSAGPAILLASAATPRTAAAATTTAPVSPAPAPLDPAAVPGSGPSPPTGVSLAVQQANNNCNVHCLASPQLVVPSGAALTLSAAATPAQGQQITSVVYQYSLAGSGVWNNVITDLPVTSAPYTTQFGPDAQGISTSGHYKLRVEAFQSDGQVAFSPVTDVVVVVAADQGAYVALQPPPADVHGTLTLVAAPAMPNDFGTTYNNAQNFNNLIPSLPDTVSFEISPAGANTWTTIASVPVITDANGDAVSIPGQPGEYEFTTTLDTTTLADGRYDVRVEAQDAAGDTYVGNVLSGIVIDNTPPQATLTTPGTQLSGVVGLTATGTDAGSGLAALRFEYAPAGSGSWTTIGVLSSAPYSLSFDTRGLVSGLYDLRVVATDVAGNVGISNLVADVSVANSIAAVNPTSFSVTNYVVSATGVTVLGTVSGSPDDETWAYGFTSAPPAIVSGSPLPYTVAVGQEQLVLLRYEDATGWQIADVLRNADGTPYRIQPNANFAITGQMASTGEAWLLVSQTGSTSAAALFHRAPGGEFLLDGAATATVQPIISQFSTSTPPVLTLGTDAGGTLYGLLINPGQRPVALQAGGVTVTAALRYGSLAGGAWTLTSAPLPTTYTPAQGDVVTLRAASATGPHSGWVAAKVDPHILPGAAPPPEPLLLGSYGSGGFSWVSRTGLDALDLTLGFSAASVGRALAATATALAATSQGVWVGATLNLPAGAGTVVALYDPVSGHVIGSWCSTTVLALSTGCGAPLDANHPAAVPDAVFDTPAGSVALAQAVGAIDVYVYGAWTAVPVAGFGVDQVKPGFFTSPNTGWLAGSEAVGRITPQPQPAPLAPWPEANQNTLTSVAVPPAGAALTTSGALAVGLDGAALHYDATQGWLTDPVPQQAQAVNLLSVAFSGPTTAIAVGGFGTILNWNGVAWSLDPQSSKLTESQLNSVACAVDGECWAVGAFGTILRFDGTTWSVEQLDPADAGILNMTSVAVAGSQVLAVAGGTLFVRGSDGVWNPFDPTQLPQSPAPPAGSLRLVSGLPDGGAVVAGQGVVLVRQTAASSFQYSDQPISGTAVALAAFRDPGTNAVRAFVSVAPSIFDPVSLTVTANVPFPAGDGELLVQTTAGWQDLSRSQYPEKHGTLEGVPEPDPVQAVAVAPDGTAAWAVGGYAGTTAASGEGAGSDVLQAIPAEWQTASIWRYDAGGSAPAPALTQATVTLPALPNTVSFAFFSSMLCNFECASVADAQPMANLTGAAAEMAAFAGQPGGPAFALLGGNAVGPIGGAASLGNGAVDLANLHNYLSPLGSLPLFAAYGPLDAVPTSADPAQPWGATFAQSPAPFGLGGVPAGITPVSWGGTSGSVRHYYSFEVAQNGGTLFVIVLDNSAGSLERSVPGQTAWLNDQLAAAQAAGLPVVVFAAEPLNSGMTGAAADADSTATLLANAGVLAVFTTSPSQGDTTSLVPFQEFPTGALQVPEYEGASLGYQQPSNDGVLWYFVSVDTVARSVSVQGIPVVQSLALQPLDGLTAAQSSTLLFRAVGRRPAGTILDTGFENYVTIPGGCSGCVAPSYSFTSSDPGIGDFVLPSAPGSLLPLLDSSGHPVHSSQSGLFCAFNPGTTTVSVTSGLLTSSESVTVLPGGVGLPCGTVNYAGKTRTTTIPGHTTTTTATAPTGGASAPPPPPPATINPVLPAIVLPPPPPIAAHAPAPPPPPPALLPAPPPFIPAAPFVGAALLSAVLTPVLVPPVPPPATPIPPGGATAPAAAKREEKARRHAQQSAYVIRPAGIPAADWFFPAVAVAGLLAMMLAGLAVGRSRGYAAEARLELWDTDHIRQRRRF
jgi:hypothetical protein